MDRRHDTVVVGAGLAGRLAALTLAHEGFGVLLCDRGGHAGGVPDPRTTALAYASARALRRLSVWDGLATRAQPVRDIAVANARPPGLRGRTSRGGALTFDDGLLGDTERWEGTPLAYLVRNGDLAAALDEACARTALIEEREGEVTDTLADQGGVTVRVGGEDVRAGLVVACDGRRSPLRRRAGLRTIERDFGQDALTFTARPERAHEGTARQLFLPGGPLAALPLTGGEVSIVWSMPRAKADALMAEPERLAPGVEALMPELGALSGASAPARFPLGLLYAPRIVADRLALVGEAGRAIHPIAGQGYNMAVADACALAQVMAEARGVGLDPGHGTVLARYDDWRRADAALTAFGTGALARGLSTSERVTRGLAGLGFGLVQRSEGLRRAFVRRAGGEAGRTPALMAADA